MVPPVLALTPGEPAGIGPDLVAALARHELPARLVVIADRGLIERRAALLGRPLHLPDYDPAAPAPLSLLHLPLAAPETPGVLDPRNGAYVLATLRAALDGWRQGRFAGLVTGPVHKGVINDAGFPFTGHTEFLADETGTPRVVMMLAGGGMRVALATTHLPLRQVADAITEASLSETLDILLADLARRFGCPRPRVLVAGLNPHAGEGGHLGDEEIRVITPVLDRYRAAGHLLEGPLPADTLFHPERLKDCDAVLAMYHDQGLPVLKHASFGEGINITLGLPLVRTSVDHGTALGLAGTGRADPGSLLAAIELAARLAA